MELIDTTYAVTETDRNRFNIAEDATKETVIKQAGERAQRRIQALRYDRDNGNVIDLATRRPEYSAVTTELGSTAISG